MTPDEITTAWLDAYNNRDPHALISLYHDDAEVFQVAVGTPLRGRDVLLRDFVAFFAAFPDNYTNPVNVIHTEAWSVVEWQGGGTFLGKLGEWEPTGQSFEIRGCGFFQIAGGKIVYQRGYFDSLGWFRQIGLVA